MNRATRAAAHLRHTLHPLVSHAEARILDQTPDHGQTPGDQARRIRGAAAALDRLGGRVDWAAENLAAQRTIAAQGRPRTGTQPGSRSTGTTSTTEAAATEMVRISSIGMDLHEALDRIGTAVTHVATMAGDALGTLNPAQAFDDLADAIDGLAAEIAEAMRLANLATSVRAWRNDPADVDPPPIEEFARCTGWPKGRNSDGDLIGCENYIGAQPHRHPVDGTAHHHDLCDSCYLLLCPGCWNAPRRTKGASWCHACAKRIERAGHRLDDLEAIDAAVAKAKLTVARTGPIRNVARPDQRAALG